MARRKLLARGLGLAAYLGLAVPGWAVASQFDMPDSEPVAKAHLVEVSEGRLSEQWHIKGAVQWSDTVEIAISSEGDLRVNPNEELSSGQPIATSRTNSVFALECEADSIEIYPLENGGAFLDCIQSLLVQSGFNVSDSERSSRVLGPTTQAALKSFYGTHKSRVPEADSYWQIEAERLQAQHDEIKGEAFATPLNKANIGKIRTLNQEAAQIANEIDEARLRRGPIVRPADWAVIPVGGVVEVESFADGKLVIGVGSKEVRGKVDIAVLSAAGLKVNLTGTDVELDHQLSVEPTVNPETGIAEVEITVSVPQDFLSGEWVDLQLTGNDTQSSKLYAPSGVIRTDGETHWVVRVDALGNESRVQVPDPEIIDRQVLLVGVPGVKAGDHLKVA